MAGGRELKKKIGSVQNTQKVTSAMQMVAASKMRRTQDRMLEARPYAIRIRDVIGHLATANAEYTDSYMEVRDIARVGYIVVSTDKGQCGGLNANLFRALLNDMREWESKDVDSELALIGNKAAAFFRSVGGNVVAAINNVGETPTVEALIGGVQVMLNAYQEGEIDLLNVVSNQFVNTMTQRPTIHQLLPMTPPEDADTGRLWDYIYEPDAKELVIGLVQRYINSQVYEAVIENTACEQAARMIAMKNATDNAGEIIDELTLLYNNARQASITQEIAEIVGGAAALS